MIYTSQILLEKAFGVLDGSKLSGFVDDCVRYILYQDYVLAPTMCSYIE